jgi:hypothetical protein
MDRQRLAFILSQLIYRIREFPDEALNELYAALNVIEHKYDLIEKLTEEERQAIEEGRRSMERGEGIPMEEVFKEFNLADDDRDAGGKEAFEDAISRVRKLSGEEQGDVADVIFAFLNEYRFDIPPPEEKT